MSPYRHHQKKRKKKRMIIVVGGPPPPPPPPPPAPQEYLKGVWASAGPNVEIPVGIINNPGIVGVGLNVDWSDIEISQGVFDFSAMDDRLDAAEEAGFSKVTLTFGDGSDKTPDWLYDLIPEDEVINLLDKGQSHSTFCQEIPTPVYWGSTYRAARLAFVAACGDRYKDDERVVAVNVCAFANQHSMDANVNDFTGIVQCPDCPQPEGTFCGPTPVDQPQQWIDAGWTEAVMLEVGKEKIAAAAAAWPYSNIRLPIGTLADPRMSTPDGNSAHGNMTQLYRDIEDFVYGNLALGIPAQIYKDRFWMTRNTWAADWREGTYWDTHTPSFNNDNYIKYMIRKHAPQSGLQAVAAGTGGNTSGCIFAGGTSGPCGTSCPVTCVMPLALTVGVSFGVTFLELFTDDAKNTALYDMISDATVAMGGTLRVL